MRIISVLAAVVAASCTAPHRQTTPAPPPAVRTETMPASMPMAMDTTPTRYTDAQFMQGMILHHAQALEMTSLIPSRTTSEQFRLLGQRIEVSQKDEIGTMQRWLRAHGADVPGLDEHHMHHDASGRMMMMPGMLTYEEMAQLEKSTGVEFERLFLQFMIRHHEGALSMVGDLFASQGGGKDPQVFAFASDVDADQRAEIKRMQTLQRNLK